MEQGYVREPLTGGDGVLNPHMRLAPRMKIRKMVGQLAV